MPRNSNTLVGVICALFLCFSPLRAETHGNMIDALATWAKKGPTDYLLVASFSFGDCDSTLRTIVIGGEVETSEIVDRAGVCSEFPPDSEPPLINVTNLFEIIAFYKKASLFDAKSNVSTKFDRELGYPVSFEVLDDDEVSYALEVREFRVLQDDA
ncbi:MAG: hypothetical protein AAF662_01380 [Pseudomonadota bacterium]